MPTTISFNFHGSGERDHEEYVMPQKPTAKPDYGPDYWDAVTNVPCPVEGCTGTIVWYEAGYVPGYRVCMQRVGADSFDPETLRHRFLAQGDAWRPTLVRDHCCEGGAL